MIAKVAAVSQVLSSLRGLAKLGAITWNSRFITVIWDLESFPLVETMLAFHTSPGLHEAKMEIN